MIFKSYVFSFRSYAYALIYLCIKISNSVVGVGLYYGFLTIVSIGPSYLFSLQALVMEKGEEGNEKKVAATTGFLLGQLMMFISIYYAPLHLAMNRPHTITVLALPYLLFHFFWWNNQKDFSDYGSTNRNRNNSMRNLNIQCVFLNNLIFQLFNHFILPSSMLARLVNVYMFRCNNKMLFVTSSLVGWLIGQILFLKWVVLVLVWIQQNSSIRSNVLIRSKVVLVLVWIQQNSSIRSNVLILSKTYKYLANKSKYLAKTYKYLANKSKYLAYKSKYLAKSYMYLVLDVVNSMARIFSILLLITCLYYLGRIPSPILTKQLKGTSEMEEIEKISPPRVEDEEAFLKENPSLSEEEEGEDPDKIDEREEIRVNGKKKTRKDELLTLLFDLWFEKPPVTLLFDSWFEDPPVAILFDSNKWNRPFRYIKNNQFQNAVKNEMSQYFFYTCQSDGKERISFMYPPSLSTFKEIIEKKISFFTTEKLLSDQLYNDWNLTNDMKRLDKTNEFIDRVRTLDKKSFDIGKKTQLCNCNYKTKKKEYFPKKYDPLLYGPYRGRIKKLFSPPSINQKIYKKKKMGEFWINKIHALLLTNDYREFKQTINKLNKSRSLVTKKRFSLFRYQTIHSEDPVKKIVKWFFNVVITKSNDQRSRKRSIEIKEISKKVPRWSYILLDDLQLDEAENHEDKVETDSQIRLRKYKFLVIFDDSEDLNEPDPLGEMIWIRYLPYSDFRRSIIKGSMRAQRRKMVIYQLYQPKPHSPLFVDRIDRRLLALFGKMGRPLFYLLAILDRRLLASDIRLLSFDIFGRMKEIFQNLMGKKSKELQISDYTKERKKVEKYQDAERLRLEIAETWDNISYAQAVRGFFLVGQSIFRKYIRLPSLIIAKNIARILLFQVPEWSEDFKDWNREIHIKCTYNGVELSEKEFPKNWLTDGMQIKILFPFYLKPWHRSKLKPSKTQKAQKNDFCFLTVAGLETDRPFGIPRKRKGPSFFGPIFKELKKKVKKLLKNKSFIVFNVFKERAKFLRKVSKEIIKKWSIKNYELGETKTGDSIMNNQMIRESPIQIRYTECTNFSPTEKKMKDLTERTSTINNKLERILNEKKNGFLTQEKNIHSNKKLESLKRFSQILKRRNTRLIRKFSFFIKFFMEKIYIDFFLCIINIARTNAQLFIESRKKIIEKSISNKKETEKRIKKRNQKKIHFILTKKNSLDNIQNTNSTTFSNSFSQAYVFYKISQTRVINFYKFKPILQYHETSLFLKNEIKDFFRKEGIFHSGLRHKDFWHSERNQWKNWLRGHYQYDLSQISWLKLVPEKWRNKVNQHCMTQKNDFNKWDSYEKERFIHDEKQNDFEPDSLLNQEYQKSSNFKKHHRHDFFSYKSINYEEKKDSYIYRSPLQINSKEEIFDNYKIDRRKFFDMSGGLPISNYLGENDIMAEEKFPDRKFCKIDFCLRNNKVELYYWLNTGTKNQKIKRGPFYLSISKNQKINRFKKKRPFFDWMGMNEEIVNRLILNPELELWFFPEFVPLYNAYKIKPGIIPIKLLLSNFNGNESINQNITERNPLIESNEKRILRFENGNQEEKDLLDQGEGDPLSDENGGRSDKKKRRKKKPDTSPEVMELYYFLQGYLHFQFRRERVNKKMIDNIKVYCFLIRLRNPKNVAISYLKRGALTVDIWTINRRTLKELSTGGVLILEPAYLSIKNDGQLILYQTIGIFLVHKNKYQRNPQYLEYVDKNQIDESILRHQKMTKNRDKNHYDFFVPETILSPKGRRELRILYFLKKSEINDLHRNPVFCNQVKNCGQVLNRGKYLGIEKKKLIKMKFFLWPNYRLEDLACMNRYWFNTNNGSRFSILRIHMYPPRLTIW
uniref:Ycf1 protein n=1 Tax=Aquilaria cumingiana TaxID=1767999 RepID=UPI002115BAB5|nr:Ycf1 protein [Aquilaria cumingiana]YP_010427505.1 Ycf1 protein [Aquilaria cumingiana]USN92886.1 Ycf1 protein [Aquilaria cumingiana]USN92907.1 Ycf1 protein [Aquilaria cumingiana]